MNEVLPRLSQEFSQILTIFGCFAQPGHKAVSGVGSRAATLRFIAIFVIAHFFVAFRSSQLSTIFETIQLLSGHFEADFEPFVPIFM
jgi:hypothetical protein